MRRLISGAALAAVSASLLWTSPPATATTELPTALSGTARETLTDVEVTAFPQTRLDAGESFTELHLKDAVVSLDGSAWTVAVDPASIPTTHMHETGVVDFNVYTVGEGRVTQSTMSARAIIDQQTGDYSWVDAGESAAYVSASDGPLAARRAASRPAVLSHKTVQALAADEPETEDDGVPVDDGAYVDPALVPGPTPCSTQATDTYDTRSTTIGTTYPVGSSEAYMKVSSSDGASYGIGVSASGDNGTFSASGSKFVQDGWSFTWNANGNARSYRKGIEYRKYVSYCGGATTQVSWRPHGETGGTGSNTDLTRPGWDKCANIDAGLWERDEAGGKAYTYGAAVKWKSVLGVDLSIKREWRASNKVAYVVQAGGHRMCGNNGDWPSEAGKVIERL